MSNAAINLAVTTIRGRHYVMAGKSRLSSGFKSREAAERDLAENASFYEYWAGSASVSVQNDTPVTVAL